jgi:quinol monooxygenase YgiN
MVGRYVRFIAAPGAGDEIAARLLDVARSLHDAPGCRVYAIMGRLDGPPQRADLTPLGGVGPGLD